MSELKFRVPAGLQRIISLLCVMLVATWGLSAKAATPDFETVKATYRSSYAILQDRQGIFLHAKRVDMQSNRLDWVPLSAISGGLVDAVLFTEDRDFFKHRGVDWGAVFRGSVHLLWGDRSRGASTISMQLVGMLEPELGWQKGGRSLKQKWQQMQAARELERRWTKSQILEAYLNVVSWRGDLQGVAVASQALLGKLPAGLNRTEGLLLASLLASPQASPDRVLQHACAQIKAGFTDVDCQRVQDLVETHLKQRQAVYLENPALDALASRVLPKTPTAQRVSIDVRVQKTAEALLRVQLAELAHRRVNAGAVLVLDNASGEVLAYVANAGLVPTARFVDGIQAKRQAGSTLKPFIYELALEQQYLTAASIVEDAPITLPTPNGLYTPQNYDANYKGAVSFRVALASSLNVPAVRVLSLVGVENAWSQLRRLGYSSLTEAPDFYGYALALGSADVSLWMQANAYRALANGGQYAESGFDMGRKETKTPVMSPQATFIINDILSDRQARALTFGLDNPLATPFWTAVKTGTSKDMRDNWCIGFSKRYTVAVWVGNQEGTPMRDVSGISGAAPVWSGVMRFLESGQLKPDGGVPEVPPGLLRQHMVFDGMNEPERDEWFLPGTEMGRVEFMPEVLPRIVYPANETVIAIDPDIPSAQQRVRFRAENTPDTVSWWLNDQRLGPATDFDWDPRPGKYRLSLRDADGQVVDSVWFTVRGERVTVLPAAASELAPEDAPASSSQSASTDEASKTSSVKPQTRKSKSKNTQSLKNERAKTLPLNAKPSPSSGSATVK